MAIIFDQRGQPIDYDNPFPVTNNGSGALDFKGLASAKPAAGDVPVGSTYWNVDTNVLEVSDGTSWSESPSGFVYVPRVVTATIANGASVSGAINLQGGLRSILGVQMPPAWTTAVITFEVSHDGTTWSQLYAPGFGVVTVLSADGAAASLAFSVNPAFFAGWSSVRVRSGTTASPVNQDAERVLRVLTRAV